MIELPRRIRTISCVALPLLVAACGGADTGTGSSCSADAADAPCCCAGDVGSEPICSSGKWSCAPGFLLYSGAVCFASCGPCSLPCLPDFAEPGDLQSMPPDGAQDAAFTCAEDAMRDLCCCRGDTLAPLQCSAGQWTCPQNYQLYSGSACFAPCGPCSLPCPPDIAQPRDLQSLPDGP